MLEKQFKIDGLLYVLGHSKMPGLLKIGYSTNPVEKRLAGLNSTEIPGGFDVLHVRHCPNPRFAERKVHAALADHRVLASREFFEIDLETAKGVVDAIVDDHPNPLVERAPLPAPVLASLDVAEIVKARRTSMGMTQQELSSQSGLSRVIIGQVERGKESIALSTATKILRALGLTLTVCERGDA